MATASPWRWISASRSHVGLVRGINEDACLDQPQQGLWAVADGMGGHTLGDFASREVIAALARLPPADSLAECIETARERLQAVNRQLRQEAASRAVQVIGSTVAVLFAHGRRCGCLWAGDSRIYLYRAGRLKQLTRDHSRVEELRALGLLSPVEAASHPARNLITRAVGAWDSLDLDAESLDAEEGDIFLLCSDGLTNEVSEEEIGAILAGGDCRQAAETLVDKALGHGGRDNVSVIVVRAEDLHSTERTELNPDFL